MQKLIISTSFKRVAIMLAIIIRRVAIMLAIIIRRVAIMLAIIILLIVSIRFFIKGRDQWIAYAYINNQSNSLTLASNELLAGNEISLEAFEEIFDHEIWQDGNTVAYYIGGYGLVPSSVYTGFIYSVDGNPYPIPDMADYPRTDTAKTIRWQQPNGDNFCEFTPIADNFYFFRVGY